MVREVWDLYFCEGHFIPTDPSQKYRMACSIHRHLFLMERFSSREDHQTVVTRMEFTALILPMEKWN
jgi:hypothetical protein